MTQKGIGRLVQVGISKETTRGTSPATADFYIPFASLSLDEKLAAVNDEESRGIIEDSVGSSITKEWVEGTLKAPVGDKHIGLILKAVLGGLSTAANADVAGTVKDHTITVAQSAQHQSISLYLDDPLAAQDYTHALGVVSDFQLDYSMGKFVEYSVGLKAKRGATATLTPAATTENRFLPQNLTFKVAADLAGLGAAAAISVKSATIKISKNIEEDLVLGNLAPADFLNKQITIEGTVEALWQNESDFKTAFLAGTNKAVRFDLINTGVTIGTAANPELRIDLAKVFFKELTRPIAINDMVKQTLSFKAHYSTGDSKMVTVLLTNLQATY